MKTMFLTLATLMMNTGLLIVVVYLGTTFSLFFKSVTAGIKTFLTQDRSRFFAPPKKPDVTLIASFNDEVCILKPVGLTDLYPIELKSDESNKDASSVNQNSPVLAEPHNFMMSPNLDHHSENPEKIPNGLFGFCVNDDENGFPSGDFEIVFLDQVDYLIYTNDEFILHKIKDTLYAANRSDLHDENDLLPVFHHFRAHPDKLYDGLDWEILEKGMNENKDPKADDITPTDNPPNDIPPNDT